jgi:mycobactin lysine-N-oxygenase
MSGTQARLAVIGAGPKAAALAARVAAIKAWQSQGHHVDGLDPNALRPAPRLYIFEGSDRIGAHWDGQGAEGYTDGVQAVCTDPDRDLVYPANHGSFGGALSPILTGFTWRTYAAARRLPTAGPPSHRDLADYVAWAVHEARHLAPNNIFLHTNSAVRSLHLHRSGPQWEVVTVRGTAGTFDGVIVTSPGSALQRFDVEQTISSWTLDAQNYWTQPMRAQVLSDVAQGSRVAIVGAGGAAAAICLDILSATTGPTAPNAGGVALIAPQASLFTRGESTFETELLTSPSWNRLPREVRRQIAERLVSGVVFARVLDALEAIGYTPEFLVGRALAATDGSHSLRSSRIELWCLTLDERLQIVDADWVIDASGFDPLWFVGLLDEPAVPRAGRPRLQRLLGRLGANVLAEKLDEHLRLHVAVELFEADGGTPDVPLVPTEPGLHVPFLAGGSRPPGLSSLLQLGVLADKILLPYLR